jgi:C4-dicarboxylate-specific signal transduction histidine kinase
MNPLNPMNQRPSSYNPPDESLQLLARAADYLGSGTDYEEILDSIAKLIVVDLASWCTIDLLLHGSIDRIAVAHHDLNRFFQTRFFLNKYPARPSAQRGVYKVVSTGESILVPHLTREDWARRADDEEHLRLIMELGSSSYMCVPLQARNRVVGAITLYSGDRTYSERELETVQKLARNVGVAVDNVLMFRQMKAALAELQATQAQLIQTAKAAAVGVMAAGIAHELNNPLAIVKGRLSLLEKQLERNESLNSEELRISVEKISQSTDRMVKIIGQVRECTAASVQNFQSLQLEDVLRSAILLFREQFPENETTIETGFDQGPHLVKGDRVRLEQVFLNLISNAKDAIKAKRTDTKGSLQISVTRSENELQINFIDDGIGLETNLKDRIFDPFFTTKSVGGGTGLGLAIARGIIKDHKGSMEFNSIPHLGTRVGIRLPAMPVTAPTDLAML